MNHSIKQNAVARLFVITSIMHKIYLSVSLNGLHISANIIHTWIFIKENTREKTTLVHIIYLVES